MKSCPTWRRSWQRFELRLLLTLRPGGGTRAAALFLFPFFHFFCVRFWIFRHYYTEEQKLFFAGTRLPDPFRLQRSWMTERGLAEKEFL